MDVSELNGNGELEIASTELEIPSTEVDLNSPPKMDLPEQDGLGQLEIPSTELEIPSTVGDLDSPRATRCIGRVNWKLIFASMVAAGIQFGWALQLSLLTPYIQTLGLSHKHSSLMWLCGPMIGFIFQPCVGVWSDNCFSRFGRRRLFILFGCLLISTALLLIGFSSDIGKAMGDTKKHCSLYHGPRWKATIVFLLGFCVLDFCNSAVQGPARALVADLSGPQRYNSGNAIFCYWIAIGNILGYSSGATGKWHRWFPFLETNVCCEACANLKGASLIALIFLIFCLAVTLVVAKETPQKRTMVDDEAHNVQSQGGGFSYILRGFTHVLRSLRMLPPGMNGVLFLSTLTWLSWYPFILYCTDWMGREIYHGNPNGTEDEINAYERGVRLGALGLLLNSIVIGITSILIEPLCRKLTPKIVWVMSNIMVFFGMAVFAIIGLLSKKGIYGAAEHVGRVDGRVKAATLILFSYFGIPLAIIYSVPFAYSAHLATNNRGLCTAVLNISADVAQVLIALSAGPWDSEFNLGNTPAFALASAIALIAGFVGIFLLPNLSRSQFRIAGFGGH